MKREIDPRRIEVVDDEIARVLRDRTPAERLKMAFAANRTARQFLSSSLRHQHPGWSAQQVHQEVVRRMLLGAE